jgi:hypothetical protein
MVKQVHLQPGECFGSLDVVSLYPSIPLEGHNNVFDVVGDLFEENKHLTVLEDLSRADFIGLLRLALCSDRINVEGNLFRQRSGVAMGNNLSAFVAIAYMHWVESQIISPDEVRFWVRYIDDVFFISRLSPEALLQKANSVTSDIKFTREDPTNGSIPFLDTLVRVSDQSGAFLTSLYVKPIHSGHTLPYDANVPLSRKRANLVTEFRRARRICSHEDAVTEAIRILTDRFRSNGYPWKEINHAIRASSRPPCRQSGHRIFFKLPYVDHRSHFEMQKIVRASKLPISISFSTPRPLSHAIRKNNAPPCPNPCYCSGRGLCFKKNVVYLVKCRICQGTYIGETGGTFWVRISQHLSTRTSNVFKHSQSAHHKQPELKDFEVKVLSAGFENAEHRRCMEASLISNYQPLMNVQHR